MNVIVNYEAPVLIQKNLKTLGYNVILSKYVENLSRPIAYHPDIQIHLLDDKTAICSPECYTYYKKNIPDYINLIEGKTFLAGTYPRDCAYNVARIGEYILCNTACTDKCLLNFYKDMGKHIIHINQGYSKCNICIIDNETILTEDIGIHNTIIDNLLPIKSYILPKGEIKLSGFDYGFIGGASGKVNNTIFWYGDLQKCSYYNLIKKITEERQVEIVSLSDETLGDFGGIICLP